MSRKGLQPVMLVVFGLNLNTATSYDYNLVGEWRGEANLYPCFIKRNICSSNLPLKMEVSYTLTPYVKGQAKLKHTAHIYTEYTLYINDTFVVTLNNVHRILFIRTSHTSETYCTNVSNNTHLIRGSIQLGLTLYKVCNHTYTVKLSLLCEKFQEIVHAGFKTK